MDVSRVKPRPIFRDITTVNQLRLNDRQDMTKGDKVGDEGGHFFVDGATQPFGFRREFVQGRRLMSRRKRLRHVSGQRRLIRRRRVPAGTVFRDTQAVGLAPLLWRLGR
jgi:hypothetical protein